MKKSNCYSKEPLLALNDLRKKDSSLVTFFAFGSFVSNKTSFKNYRETRIFDNGKFLVSNFKLITINPDIDLVYVSNNVEKSERIINEEIKVPESHYLTINLITPEVFESEIFSSEPKAIRRILMFRELLIIKGQEYMEDLKRKALETINPGDSAFQTEFDFRKDYLRVFAKYNIEEFMLDAQQYSKLFPLFYQFINKKLDAGFPEDRHKLVFPETMKIKYFIDIQKNELTELE